MSIYSKLFCVSWLMQWLCMECVRGGGSDRSVRWQSSWSKGSKDESKSPTMCWPEPVPLIDLRPECLSQDGWENKGSLGQLVNLLPAAVPNRESFEVHLDGKCSKICLWAPPPPPPQGYVGAYYGPYDYSSETCIQIPFVVNVNFDLSIVIYVKQTGKANDFGSIMSRGHREFDGGLLMHDKRFRLDDGEYGLAQGVGDPYYALPAIQQDRWRLIVAVWKGGLGGVATLYLDDGTEYAQTTITQSSDGLEQYFCMNTNPRFDGHSFTGCFNNIRIYDRALSIDEVRFIYEEQFEPFLDQCTDNGYDKKMKKQKQSKGGKNRSS